MPGVISLEGERFQFQAKSRLIIPVFVYDAVTHSLIGNIMSANTKLPAKKKQPASTETSRSIEEQTRAFLKAGGSIQYINNGVSSQVNIAGPKHIYLGSKPGSK
jgi:hypothetical protein